MDAPIDVAYDASGGLYVATPYALRKIAPGGIITRVAGTTTAGSGGDGGTATLAGVNTLRGVAVMPSGDVVMSDSINCTVRKLSGGLLTTIAGTAGQCTSGGDTGLATAATFNNPYGLAVDASSAIYVTDYSGNRLRKFSVGGVMTTLTGNGTPGASGDGGTASAATIRSPAGIALGASGTDYYLAETIGNRVRYVNTALVLNTVVGNGNDSYSGDGVANSSTQLRPESFGISLALDAMNGLNVGGRDQRIRRLDLSSGLSSTLIGNGTGGTAASNLCGNPGQVTLDTSGRVVYAGAALSCSMVATVNGDGTQSVIAGNYGASGYSGDGGLATGALMNVPRAVAYDVSGNLFVFDSGNQRLRKVDASGYITNYGGNGSNSDSGDGGLAVNAGIGGWVNAIATDRGGNVYIAEKDNHVIRMIDTTGHITRVGGNGTCVGGTGDGSPAVTAEICNPSGLSVDSAGNIFIAATSDGKIRKIDASTGLISTVVGGTGTVAGDDSTYLANDASNVRTVLAGSDSNLYFWNDNVSKIHMAKALASTATNGLASASWTVAPAAVGHSSLREMFSVVPSQATATSKMTFVMPAGVAATPTVVSSFGLSGGVTASLLGTTLTVSFPSQTLRAGVPVGLALEGFTNGGTNGSYSSNVTMYDSAGTTAVGWARSSVVNLTSGAGAPGTLDAGYSSVWSRSLTASAAPTSLLVAASPLGNVDQVAAFNLTTSGTLNSNSLSLAASALSSIPGGAPIAKTTTGVGVSVSAAAFGVDSWGVGLSSTSGVFAGALSPTSYVGATSSGEVLASSVSAVNTFSLRARTRIDYLVPAGLYSSALATHISPGT